MRSGPRPSAPGWRRSRSTAWAAPPHARRHPGRLRARDPALVAAGDRLMRSESLLDRPVYFVSSNSHASPPAHRGRAAPCRRARGRGRSRRWRRIARRVAALPRQQRQGHWKQLPVLRGARAAPPPPRSERAALRREEPRSGLVERDQPDRARCRRPGHPLDRVTPETAMSGCCPRALRSPPAALSSSNIDYPLGSPRTTSCARSPRPSTFAASISSARLRPQRRCRRRDDQQRHP